MNKPSFNLADLFEQVADAVPERQAVVCGDKTRNYSDIEARANRLAHYLQSRGLGAGDHVGLYLYNCIEYIEAMIACFKIRAVPININYRYVEQELVYIFRNADLKACIHHREFVPAIATVAGQCSGLDIYLAVDDGSASDLSPIGGVGYEQALSAAADIRDFAARADDDLFILYTGGTTGQPKGVIWPHKSVFFAAMGGGGYFHPEGAISRPDEICSRITAHPIVVFTLAPLMHGASWWSACIQLLAGNTVALNPNSSLVAEEVWGIVESMRVNMLTIVGDAIAIPLLDALAAEPSRWDLSSIFGISSGGAVFSDAKQREFKAYFPGVVIANAFGSSESGAMGADAGEERRTTGGLGIIDRSEFMSVVVQAEAAPLRHAGAAEEGIFARSGYIPLGYYNDAKKTAENFVEIDGVRWLLTGDRARLEGDMKTITIFGRGSNCINSGGEKIFPEEVEGALKAHSGIFDALVVGVPDERWGSRVSALVQLRGDAPLSLTDIQRHCRALLAAYKIPREVHTVTTIPRLPSGKPDYVKARELVTLLPAR